MALHVVPESPTIAIPALHLHLHLRLHPCNHLLHAAELSFFFQQDLVFIHVLILHFPAASLKSLRTEVFIMKVLGHLLEILHVCDEHGSQLQKVVVLCGRLQSVD